MGRQDGPLSGLMFPCSCSCFLFSPCRHPTLPPLFCPFLSPCLPSWLSLQSKAKTALHACAAFTACNQPNQSSSPRLAPIPPPSPSCPEILLDSTPSHLSLPPSFLLALSPSLSFSLLALLCLPSRGQQAVVPLSSLVLQDLSISLIPCRSLRLLRPAPVSSETGRPSIASIQPLLRSIFLVTPPRLHSSADNRVIYQSSFAQLHSFPHPVPNRWP
ncbi:hypothetical protein LZ30DRAFT_14133 [Colletotrichum cereale]|nr:hypothetical protein LZ30DRAFT_14133 [Colletotrichum cereale]